MRKIDFYLYDDVDVLKNNLDIKDKDVLERVEADLVKYRITLIRQNNFKINSVFDIKKITIFYFQLFSRGQENFVKSQCINQNQSCVVRLLIIRHGIILNQK